MSITGANLTLFVTGDAPRSRRARANLARILEAAGQDATAVVEVDLLGAPQQALDHGIFASPALMIVPSEGEASVMYGDLSDEDRVARFLGLGKHAWPDRQ